MDSFETSKCKKKFLLLHVELFQAVLSFCSGDETNNLLSIYENNILESRNIWEQLKSVSESCVENDMDKSIQPWISTSPTVEILTANLNFLTKKTRNWDNLKSSLEKNFFLEIGSHKTPSEAYTYILNQNGENHEKFLQILTILRESENEFIANLLHSSWKCFAKNQINIDSSKKWNENEEGLSKLVTRGNSDGPNNDWKRHLPNFLNYVDLSYYNELSISSHKLDYLISPLRSDNFQTDDRADPELNQMHKLELDNSKFEEESHGDVYMRPGSILKQCGTLKRYEIFSALPHNQLNILTWIHLECLDIYTPFLFKTLSNSPNLKILRLLEVRFVGELTRRITLPKLQTFAVVTRLSNLEKADGRCIDKGMFKSVIFFDKGHPWSVENIVELNVDIDITIFGERIFKIRRRDGLLYSQLKFTNDILENISSSPNFQLNQLFIRFCNVEISVLPKHLKLLEVKDVEFPRGTNLADVLNHCDLETLRIGHSQSAIFSLLQLTETKGLKNLYVYNAHIPYTPVVVKLDILFLYCCSLAPETIDKFSRIFKFRRLLLICKTMEHCTFCSFCSHVRILNEARKSECAKWISVKKFDRGHRNNHEDKRDYLVEQDVESFLRKAGVSEGSTHFIIEKNSSDVWIGKDVVVDGEGWIEQERVIQKFEVAEEDISVPDY